MLGNIAGNNELTLHVILATVPQRQEKNFFKSIQEDYYENYRKESIKYCSTNDQSYFFCTEDSKKKIPVLYNPLRYHILGNYDIAYITVIDNFKFAQRLFEPKIASPQSEELKSFSSYSFQSFTGTTYHSKEHLKNYFFEKLKPHSKSRKYFVGICNLKLNNAFLIGNGNDFIQGVYAIINKEIDAHNNSVPESDKAEFLILKSFSWFEFSLIIFTDNPDSIAKILRSLRRISIKRLENYKTLIEESLYAELYKKENLSHDLTQADFNKLSNAHVFADTHTYFGFHCDLIEKKNSDKFLKEFVAKGRKISFKTEIEWQVKPGHMPLLIKELHNSKKKYPLNFNPKSKYFLIGKSDYLIQEKSDNVLTNLYLLRLTMDEKSNIYDHVRKIRTRILFAATSPSIKLRTGKSLSLNKELKKLSIQASLIRKMDAQMRALKISRQIRAKTLKIFTNYNNGIQDAILFPYFLDFIIFIQELIRRIKEEYNSWVPISKSLKSSKKNPTLTLDEIRLIDESTKENFSPEVSKLEEILMKHIMIFQEGYNIRMLNCYQYEDINDFDLDFNTSIQQLLSLYSTLAFNIGNLFYEKKYEYGPIVQLNLKDTVANVLAPNKLD